jgi:hypothetical protein
MSSTQNHNKKLFLSAFTVLIFVLSTIFYRAHRQEYVVFSNDGPLGAMTAEQNRLPQILTGMWTDLNWIGGSYPAPSPNCSTFFRLVITPLTWSKYYPIFSLLIFGLGAALAFRRFGLSPWACILGAIAAALNTDFLGVAAWGVCAHTICAGMAFLALAAAYDPSGRPRLPQVILAGLCVGIGLMEGYDVGALFSLFLGAFVIVQALMAEGSTGKKLFGGGWRVVLVAVFAAFIATHTLSTLVGTQIKGVVGMAQDKETKERRWDEATQWSMPPTEMLRTVIPGLFGYRMDTPSNLPEWQQKMFEGGAYWGRAGETPGWFENKNGIRSAPGSWGRFSGGGTYLGVLVALICVWAIWQSLRKSDSVFTLHQRRWVWFWSAVAVVSLLLAFGRYAPVFYKLFYSLPYMSTIRNPAKFMHIFNWALLIIFAYGVHGVSRRYLETATNVTSGFAAHLSEWWSKSAGFERAWSRLLVILLAVSAGGWVLYAGNKKQLIARIMYVEFPEEMARSMAAFSIGEVGLFVALLGVSVLLLLLVASGWFGGKRAWLAGILMGLLLTLDLARANLPWILFQDVRVKYASNPVIDFLKQNAHEHRVIRFPAERFIRLDRLPREAAPVIGQVQQLQQIYGVEWSQHLFHYYNIQSLDIIQEPRMATDKAAYEAVMMFAPVRRWELTNTRYLLAPSAFLEVLNAQIDAERKRFRAVMQFDITLKPGVTSPSPRLDQTTAVLRTNGTYALIEFTGALPRAKLYSQWQTITNDATEIKKWSEGLQAQMPGVWAEALAAQTTEDLATLRELTNPKFNPEEKVLLAEALPGSSVTNIPAGEVSYVSYAPKHLVLKANAKLPSVLLLNDKFDPNWKVTVNGKPASLLRANHIVRAVHLPSAGEYTIEFKFEPSTRALKMSLAAIALGAVLLIYVVFFQRKETVA